MNFLPLVHRELRAAARRKSTFRIRSWTVILAIVVSAFSLAFLGLTRGRGTLGGPLFVTLTRYTFGLCLLAGVFLTADSLSEEKREGTLGLLFLTDLSGYDVVLGKFAATLVNTLYGLLALLPITAIPLLLGGLSPGEFWRTALALVNGLFVSLAAGIWVSALARDAQRAMGRALGVILFLVAGLPVLALVVAHSPLSRPIGLLVSVSPFYPFSFAGAAMYFSHAGRFWGTLAASQALGWVFLALASRSLPHRWQDESVDRVPASPSASLASRWRQKINRPGTRRDQLDSNPIQWLAGNDAGFGRLAWVIVLIWGGWLLLVTLFSSRDVSALALGLYSPRPFGFPFGGLFGPRPFGFLLKSLLAVQVCRFFVEARRNGALEMLLCTPLTGRDLLRGQAAAVRRAFLWPVVTFVLLLFVPDAVQFLSGLSALDFQKLLTGGIGFSLGAITAVRTIADCFTIFWVGLWLALTMKKPAYAPALTILLVLIIPSAMCWLDIFADLFFILWAATKLQQDFRWVLAQR